MANGEWRIASRNSLRYSLFAIRYSLLATRYSLLATRYSLFATHHSLLRGTPMTYCCGILVRDGLVMMADTRTNAGLDNISVFRKLHTFAVEGERVMAIASAGNLSITQSVLSTLREGLENPAS